MSSGDAPFYEKDEGEERVLCYKSWFGQSIYDRMSWKFIHNVLVEVGFPPNLINVIMKSNVLWNGNRSPFFAPERGLRQGDPLSPYLLVLALDKLSRIISKRVDDGSKMRAGREGPLVSHLMSADDLLIFGEASISQMQTVTGVLEEFCSMSGQQVSVE